MGCGQSKIENEEAVTRCKDRKQLMKNAVNARNAFAAAHSAYAMSLKNTGAALSDYAHGEVHNSVPTKPVVPTTDGMAAPPPPFDLAPPPPLDLAPPPPPPLNTSFAPTPLQRAASMPEMKMPDNKKPVGPSTILEEEGGGDDEVEAEDNDKLVSRRRRGYKGSGSGGGSSSRSRDRLEDDPSPSSASHPVVETRAAAMQAPQSSHGWADYLFASQENMVGPNLGAVEEEEEEEEKQQKVFDEMPARVEEVVEEVSKSTKVEAAPVEKVPIEVLATGGGSVGKSLKKGKAGVGAASSGTGERRLMKGTMNLLQIFEQLDDHFLKASESAYEVSKMLEATRLHYHSNFADNRGNDPRNKLISVVVVKH